MPQKSQPFDDPQSDTDVFGAFKRLWDAARKYFGPYWSNYEDEMRFVLKREHYSKSQDNTNDRDRRRIKYRGNELFSKHRRKVGQICADPTYIECRPVDDEGDPQTAEEAKWLLEYETTDPRRKFNRQWRYCVSSAIAARAGGFALDVDWSQRPYPLIMPRFVDPRMIGWTPGWQDPDDVTCPWVYEEFRMQMRDVLSMKRQGWKQTDQVRPDDGRTTDAATDSRTNTPLTSLSTGSPSPGGWDVMDSATGVRFWVRDDDKIKQQDTGKPKRLAPASRYMACVGNSDGSCNYAEAPMDGDGSNLPLYGDACPVCGQQMERADEEQPTEELLAFPRGRLVVIFPFSGVVCYDGPWPQPMRNVPLWVYKCYAHPTEPWGQSDGSIERAGQIISNSLMRRIYEQATGVGGIIVTSDKLVDPETKEPLQFTDEPLQVALWEGTGPPQVTFFQAGGNPAALVSVYQMVQQNWRADMGTGEVSVSGSAEQLKGVAVGAVQEAAASGEIPIAEHIREAREIKSGILGNWYDMARAVYTEQRMLRLRGPEGVDEYRRLRASSLPNMDVQISDEPTWQNFDAERMKALKELYQAPPELWPVLAKIMKAPPSIVRDLQKAKASVPPAPPVGPPGAAPPGPPGAPMNGAPQAAPALMQ